MLRDHAAAEDACQAAFLKAVTHGQGVDADRLGAWMGRVVSNECLTRLRRRRTRQKHRPLVAHHQHGRSDQPVSGTPEENAEHAAWLLDQLDVELAEVVTLRVMRGCSGQETARLLQVSPATVSKRLHRAMEQLREIERQH